jgi:hypothetical protein
VKINKTGLEQFCRFTENRSIFFLNLENIEKWKLKKSSDKAKKPTSLPFFIQILNKND